MHWQVSGPAPAAVVVPPIEDPFADFDGNSGSSGSGEPSSDRLQMAAAKRAEDERAEEKADGKAGEAVGEETEETVEEKAQNKAGGRKKTR